MEIHKNNLGLNLLQKLIGDAKRVVIRGHENSPLQIDHSIRNLRLLSPDISPSRAYPGGIVRGTKQPPLWTLAIALDTLKVIYNLALVPHMVTGGYDVDIEFEQFFC